MASLREHVLGTAGDCLVGVALPGREHLLAPQHGNVFHVTNGAHGLLAPVVGPGDGGVIE